jgi:GTP cyclohydrolase IA
VGNPRVLRHLPRGLKKPDRARMAKAVREFLEAAGMDLTDPNLAETPRRVAEAWATELIDGYSQDPAAALGEVYPAPAGSAGEMVVITDLRFHSMCPHHLLPYEGRAHLAYVPGKSVVGFGRLSALLDVFAHRLILQEDLAREVARTMARALGSPATACVLEAQQACLRIRGDRQRDACTHAEAYEGLLRKDRELRRELWARIGARK